MSDMTATFTASALRRVGVVVLPGFSLLAEACATEPLAVANRLAVAPLYSLVTLGLDERPVPSGSHQLLTPDRAVAADDAFDLLLICAPWGESPTAVLVAWLRRLAVQGKSLVGIGGGAELLASAGLLDGYRATVPWPRFEAVAGAHPGIRLSRQLFEITLLTGFSSAAHFSTAYRNHFGQTPREERLADAGKAWEAR